ncbi:MAG TPA: hypothetical protein ENK18_18040 [Deltaproteobacteria bacterium]|nr:hypothetical protein [Deltaproteobacteria bacterium]
MKRLYASAVLAGLAACLNQPTLVSINPEHAYVDGCVDVMVQGHHLGTTATADIGGSPLELIAAEADPDGLEHAQDVGFLYTGQVPPSPTGERGFFDVNLTVDGELLTLFKGFYYQTCPASVVADDWDIPSPATVGSTFSFVGCNLTAENVQGVFYDADCVEVATAPITPTCSTAQADMVVPQLDDGTYTFNLRHTDGTIADFGWYTYDYYYGTTADTAAIDCPGATVQIGAAATTTGGSK